VFNNNVIGPLTRTLSLITMISNYQIAGLQGVNSLPKINLFLSNAICASMRTSSFFDFLQNGLDLVL